MTLANAEVETDLYYAEGTKVYRRGVVEVSDITNEPTGRAIEEQFICECSDFVEGAAEQIVRALNRLPKAEAVLVDVVARIRAEAERADDIAGLEDVADAIEEWMCAE